ncbi:restriction endonuclease subunit S [Streptomyces sp. NPDC048665]|uniref:restriction endonuclease subunit S n=1 Tax=Streptomyces sp. NPDC048665 TaxID=3155490 RepID=UPI0034339106
MTTDSGVGPGGSGSGGDVTDAEELPAGWVRATLGELGVEVQPGFASGKHNRDGKGILHLRPMNITRNGVLDTLDARYVVDNSDRRVELGDVLFNNTNSPALVGKTAWVDSVEPLAYSNHMTRLRGPEGLDGKFLAAQLHHMWATGYFKSILNNHVNQASVSRKALLDTVIVVPPLAEQHRIVAKLDDQLVFIGAGEGSLGIADAKGGHFLQAVLHDALRGKLAPEDLSEGDAQVLVRDSVALDRGPWDIPDGWRWATIGKLFKVAVGSTPSRGNSAYWGGDVPWVSSGEVSFARISSTRESITVDSITSPEARIHPPGTVMIAMIGEGRTRGQAAILDIPAAHNQNCASIRVSETAILPEFVYYFLMARYEETRREASGGNQPALNKGKVENLEIPIPPLGTQRNIVARVQGLEEDLRGLREAVTDGWARASKLRNALLHAAFTGALMPQDPDDEPASVLLDRIRAQRSAEVRPARRKRASRMTAPTAPQASGRPIPSGTQEALPL